MTFVRSILLQLATLAIACTPSGGSPAFAPDTSAVVEHELFNQATCGRLSEVGGADWTPTENMVQRLESTLLERLVRELEVDAAFYEHTQHAPADYVRRYSGFSTEGRPLIAICGELGAMYERAGQDWRTSHIPFRDGGSSSFGAMYDPISDDIIYFEFGYNA